MFLEICPISSNAQPRTAGRGTTAPWTAPLYRLRPSATTFPADFLEHLISGHRNKSRASFVQSASPLYLLPLLPPKSHINSRHPPPDFQYKHSALQPFLPLPESEYVQAYPFHCGYTGNGAHGNLQFPDTLHQ